MADATRHAVRTHDALAKAMSVTSGAGQIEIHCPVAEYILSEEEAECLATDLMQRVHKMREARDGKLELPLDE